MMLALTNYALLGWIVWPLVLVVSEAVDGLFCGMETGIYGMNKIRLELRAEGGSRQARLLRRMIGDAGNLLAVLLIGTNVARYVATFSITSMFVMAGFGHLAEWYTLAVAAPVLFVIGDSVPKGVFQRQGERLVYRFAWLLRVSDLLFKVTGLSLLVRGVSAGLMRLAGAGHWGRSPGPPHHPGAVLAEAYASGVMTRPQSVMADRVMHIGEVKLADVMTPLSQAVTAPADVTPEQLRQRIRDHNYSRLPILDAGGAVVGIFDVYDVLGREGDVRPADGMIEPLVLPADLDVTAALYRMQKARRAMAIVGDADGKHVGLITIKDLVEEIVGEIAEW